MNITILDSTIRRNYIRIIKSPNEILGFNIKNETGDHLFIEVIWTEINGEIKELIIRK